MMSKNTINKFSDPKFFNTLRSEFTIGHDPFKKARDRESRFATFIKQLFNMTVA
jgi:hypothetical protein